MKYAVCALIFQPVQGDKVLAVSRKDNPNDFGLPGGKVDDGENLVSAVKRELLEETGLTCTVWRPIFSAVDGEYYVTTFFVSEFEGDIKTKETGVVKFVSSREIMSDNASFRNYNKKLFSYLYNIL